jgi:hypothetical protein
MSLSELAKDYEAATAAFYQAAIGLNEEELDRAKAEGWNARQVIHHVADSEAQSYARLRRLVAEPGAQIQGYDEAAWGENDTLGYKELPIKISLDVFLAVRASSLEIIKRLNPDQLKNTGIHSESGEYSIENWIATYTNHPQEHAEQIRSGL